MKVLELVLAVGGVAGVSAFVGLYVWYVLSTKYQEGAEVGIGGTCDNQSFIETPTGNACDDGTSPVSGFCDTHWCNDGSQTRRLVSPDDIRTVCTAGQPMTVNIGAMTDSACVAIGGTKNANGQCVAQTCKAISGKSSIRVMPYGNCNATTEISLSPAVPHVPNDVCRALGGLPESGETCRLSVCLKKK